jgi:hypothetical protein
LSRDIRVEAVSAGILDEGAAAGSCAVDDEDAVVVIASCIWVVIAGLIVVAARVGA